MKKVIAFVMYTGVIGQGFYREFQSSPEFDPVLINDYQNAELYLDDKTPCILVIEVPDHSSYPLSYCLEICNRFKRAFPLCKCMLFLSYTYMDNILSEVVAARRNGQIDDFATAHTRVEEISAAIQALA